MTTLGSQTSSVPITSPAGTSTIVQIIAAGAGTSNAVGNATVFLRISGQGITGEQDITIGAVGFSLLTSGGAAGQFGPVILTTAIASAPSQAVTMNADTDTGGTIVTRLDVIATLVFQ
jgi:hypothetical protein